MTRFLYNQYLVGMEAHTTLCCKADDQPKTRKRRIRKGGKERLRREGLGQFLFKTTAGPDYSDDDCQLINVSSQNKTISKRYPLNFIQHVSRNIPENCIFTIYGMITIDEEALKQKSKDTSLIRSIFQFYTIREVEVNPNFVTLHIHKIRQNSLHISYIVERLKNYGDRYFYELALKIEKIIEFMALMQQPFSLPPCTTDEQVQKYLEMVRGKKCMLRISNPATIILTKELLQSGLYSVNQIATECLCHRSFVSDIFLADDYRSQIDRFFELFELNLKLRRGQITRDEYLQKTSIEDTQYLISKDNNMARVATKKYNFAPGIGCCEIVRVEGIERLVEYQNVNWYFKKKSDSRLEVAQKLIKVPDNMKNSKINKICSYVEILEKSIAEQK